MVRLVCSCGAGILNAVLTRIHAWCRPYDLEKDFVGAHGKAYALFQGGDLIKGLAIVLIDRANVSLSRKNAHAA
jgi:hypothetical protein